MIQPFKLAKIFAAMGFCAGILISGLGIYFNSRGIHLGLVVGLIVYILFPTMFLLGDLEPGKTVLAGLLLVLSVINGFLYAAVGFVIVQVVARSRERLARHFPGDKNQRESKI